MYPVVKSFAIFLHLVCLISHAFHFPPPHQRLFLSSLHAVKYNLADTVEVANFLEVNDKVSGVFAVVDDQSVLRYVGASEMIANDVRLFLEKHGSNVVNSLRLQTFETYDADFLDAYKQELIRQTNPSGNGVDAEQWELNSVKTISGEKAEAQIHTETAEEKLNALKSALEENDKINTASDEIVTSPFEDTKRSSSTYVMGTGSYDDELEFNAENVNKVLDEVRPYLIADGGNVAVVSVDPIKRDVVLSLQGACGSCPSSTTTMKMGIERVLKENFSDLGSVSSISETVEVQEESLLKWDAIESALESVLPAIKGMGGKIEILSVEASSGEVLLKFAGPARLKTGVELVLKDVKYVKSVKIVDFV